jgi:hypothetical protein
MVQRFALSILALAALVIPVQAQVQLRWNLKEGDKIYVESKGESQQAMKVMGQDSKNEITQSSLVSFTVLRKEDDGSLLLEQKIESMKIKSTGIGGDAVAKAAEKTEGASFKLTLSPKGDITKVEGLEEFLNKVAGEDASQRRMMQTVFSEDAARQMASDIFGFLPDKPLKKGDRWERTSSMSMGPIGKLGVESKYTYDGKETVDGKPLDKISFTASTSYTPPKEGGSAPFKVTKGELKSEQFMGTLYFDSAAGRLARSELNTKIKGSLTMSTGGQEVQMELNQATVSKTRVSDKNPLQK